MSGPNHPRGTSNRNDPSRGTPAQRRARKRWLLETYGNGTYALCAIALNDVCLGVVDYDTLQVDRYPVPGRLGGTYDRDNIRPACGPCNSIDGSQFRELLKLGASGLACVTTDTVLWHSRPGTPGLEAHESERR